MSKVLGKVDHQVFRFDHSQRTEDVLRCLTPMQRAVIEARFLYGMKSKEVADVLGISEATVNVHQHTGIRRARRFFGLD